MAITEIWREIIGFNGRYFVSDKGRIKSLFANKIRILIPRIQNGGYMMVYLCGDNMKKNFLVHRLVAENFIQNTFNKTDVNHKNGNKLYNNLINLEWATRSENCKHAFRIGLSHPTKIKGCIGHPGTKGALNPLSKAIIQYDKNGILIKKWGSGQDIQRELGFFSGNISLCCHGKIQFSYGYKWKFA